MASQPDTRSNHVVVDIAGAEPSCCAVCTEPLAWVAIGPCGHGDVCADCTTKLRFLDGDQRCCICRTHCPTVLITSADKPRLRSFSKPRPAVLRRDGRVDESYWYDGDMGAYFDDRRQYRVMRKLCIRLLFRDLLELDVPQPECPCLGWFLAYIAAMMMLALMCGLFYTVATHFYQKVIIGLAFGLPSAALTAYAIFIWHKFKCVPNGDS